MRAPFLSIKIQIFLLLAIFILTVWGCAPKQVQILRSRLLMGHVPVQITIRTRPSLREYALQAMEDAYSAAKKIESEISEYQPTSDISCLNRKAGHEGCKIGRHAWDLIQISLRISKKTKRAFDLRFSSLSLEGFRAPLKMKKSTNFVKLTHPKTRLGVGAIGKGYIVDQMAEVLIQKGFSHFLINAGGDLKAVGGPWKVALQVPKGNFGEVAHYQEIENQSLATSGLYEQGAHITDPRTGQKLLRPGSVTVMSSQLTIADALATALLVLGENVSQKILKLFPQTKIFWLDDLGKVREYSLPHHPLGDLKGH